MRFFLFVLFFISCTKKPLTYSKEDLFFMARDVDPNVSLVLPSSINDAVNCAEYGEGCLHGHKVMSHNLEFIAVEFDTPENALLVAKGIRAWTVRNWVLDDVNGEPVLEEFVKKAFPEAAPSMPKK